MNKSEMIDAIVAKLDCSKADAKKHLEATLEVVKETVMDGESVQLIGFGTFERRLRAAGESRNPRTGETMKREAAFYPAFKAGKAFKDLVKA